MAEKGIVLISEAASSLNLMQTSLSPLSFPSPSTSFPFKRLVVRHKTKQRNDVSTTKISNYLGQKKERFKNDFDFLSLDSGKVECPILQKGFDNQLDGKYERSPAIYFNKVKRSLIIYFST